jgi:hypothetical protein
LDIAFATTLCSSIDRLEAEFSDRLIVAKVNNTLVEEPVDAQRRSVHMEAHHALRDEFRQSRRRDLLEDNTEQIAEHCELVLKELLLLLLVVDAEQCGKGGDDDGLLNDALQEQVTKELDVGGDSFVVATSSSVRGVPASVRRRSN